MTTHRWRGTVVYLGALAGLAAIAVARFGGLPFEQAAPAVAGSTVPAGDTGGSTSGSGSAVPDGTSPSNPGTGTPDASTVTVGGDVAQTPYGPVQVAVTFTGTRIVDVQTVQSPVGPESSQIAARSTPILAQEVVSAQSSHIDTVSGATYTSEGYRESVQSAIDARG
ncbi:FMN-binding protein [Promicromonospora kroppenstedtii]|uniref:FMN-binding protein n=1 Tax=Promicromonospora kroppenstedtii TaxID=440482 RepID=A0ABW7XPU1_9MICO